MEERPDQTYVFRLDERWQTLRELLHAWRQEALAWARTEPARQAVEEEYAFRCAEMNELKKEVLIRETAGEPPVDLFEMVAWLSLERYLPPATRQYLRWRRDPEER